VKSNPRILMLLENCAYIRDDRVRREARSLAAAGLSVSVIAPRMPGRPFYETVDGVHVYSFPEPVAGHGFLGYLWEYGYSMVVVSALAFYLFLTRNFDVIHAHQPPDTFALIAAFYKLFGKKYVLDHHDLAPELYYARFRGEGNALVFKSLVFFEKLACRLADHVIATNQSYKLVEMERGQVPESRITIVRNGPDLKELASTGPDPDVRKMAGTIIGYVGVMGVQDGVDNLLRALECLRRDFGKSDFMALMVGDGAAFRGLKELTEDLGLSDHVHFTGWVTAPEQVARYLSSMDICVAPEPSDPYNNRSTAAKVMEYMTFGKPIVAFDLPEHRFTAQEAAVYARPNDVTDLARQIAFLIDRPDERNAHGEYGRQRLVNEFAWEHQAKHLFQIYRSLSI
jgi:glycosyltransferase involved in cell wall biosynthesis